MKWRNVVLHGEPSAECWDDGAHTLLSLLQLPGVVHLQLCLYNKNCRAPSKMDSRGRKRAGSTTLQQRSKIYLEVAVDDEDAEAVHVGPLADAVSRQSPRFLLVPCEDHGLAMNLPHFSSNRYSLQ
jgi:hypothetical protein